MCTAGSSRFWQCSGQRLGRSVFGGWRWCWWWCWWWWWWWRGSDWLSLLLLTDWLHSEKWTASSNAPVYQGGRVKERGSKRVRERKKEGGVRQTIPHPSPPSCIREEGYPSFPSSQHRDLLSAVSSPAASYCRLGHGIQHLHRKSLSSA